MQRSVVDEHDTRICGLQSHLFHLTCVVQYFNDIIKKLLSQMNRYIQHSHDRRAFPNFDRSAILDAENYIELFGKAIKCINEREC